MYLVEICWILTLLTSKKLLLRQVPYQKKIKQGIDNMQPYRRQTLGRQAVGLEDIRLLKENFYGWTFNCNYKLYWVENWEKAAIEWFEACCGILMKTDNQYKKSIPQWLKLGAVILMVIQIQNRRCVLKKVCTYVFVNKTFICTCNLW